MTWLDNDRPALRPLRNKRHEMVASLIAIGYKPEQAGVAAGYKPQPGKFRLHTRSDIQKRVDELREVMATQQIAAAGLDRSQVLRNLEEIIGRCMQQRRTSEKIECPECGHHHPGVFRFDARNALYANQLYGQELGMFAKRLDLHHHREPTVDGTREEIVGELVDWIEKLGLSEAVIHEIEERRGATAETEPVHPAPGDGAEPARDLPAVPQAG